MHRTHGMSSRKKAALSRAISCEPCRRRKLKCDRVRPCSSCVSRKEGDQCTWETGTEPPASLLDPAHVLARVEALESSIEALSAAVRDTAPRSAAENSRVSSILSGMERIQAEQQSISLSFHGSDPRKARELLLVMQALLPSVPDMERLVEIFLESVDGMDDVLGSTLAHQHLRSVIECKETLVAQPDALHLWEAAQLQQRVYSYALCMILFASASVHTQHTVRPLVRAPLTNYLNVSLNALATLDIYQEPNTLFVLIAALLLTHFMYALRPPIAAELLYHAMNISVMLRLHYEPPSQMGFDEAKRRVRWYALLCASDWDLTSAMERHPIFPMDKTRFPSLFGTDHDRSRYLSPSILGRLLCARLSFRTTSLSRSQEQTWHDTEELHRDILRAMTIFQDVLDASTTDQDHLPHTVPSKFGIASLHYLLIYLHVPYYARAWDDEQFSLSKTTCYESALFLLHLFKDMFQCSLTPQDKGVRNSLSRMANYFQFTSRWCCAAGLLLVTHLVMSHERGRTAPDDAGQKALVDDLCTLSCVLQFLSHVSEPAREGYAALQRASLHVMKQSHACLSSRGNCVMLWAQQLYENNSEWRESQQSEPLSLLWNVMSGQPPARERLPEQEGDAGAQWSAVPDLTLWDYVGVAGHEGAPPEPQLATLWTADPAYDTAVHWAPNDQDWDRFINSLLSSQGTNATI